MRRLWVRQSARGFTLVELLVVIAIIGVLVALLLPAVQSAREAARMMQCKNHLKQMSLSALTHENAHNHLPHGGWGFQCVGLPDKGAGVLQPGGWVYNLLPFIEQSALHQQTDLKQTVSTPQAWLHCPSRRRAIPYPAGPASWQPFWTGSLTTVAKNDYAINGGTVSIDHPGSSNKDVPPAVAETDGIVGRAFVVELSKISDGTTNTYMIGEKYVNPDHYLTSNDLGDNENAYIGSDRDTLRTANGPRQDRNGLDNSYAYGSAHSAGFNMAMCDGSVRTLRYEIDLTLHKYLVQKSDGQVVDHGKL